MQQSRSGGEKQISKKRCGLIGWPVAHSLSPLMQEAAFAALQLNCSYELWAVKKENLQSQLTLLRTPDFLGCNVTLPYKEQVLDYLDEVAPEAQLCGAVNTIVNDQGKLIGYNTDGSGFTRFLTDYCQVAIAGLTVMIMGAGGAARAVAAGLLRADARQIVVVNRGLMRARTLASKLPGPICVSKQETIAEILPQIDLLINATSVGMAPDIGQSLLTQAQLKLCKKEALVADLVYTPLQTRLLQEAEACDLPTVPGWGMLLHQGALAFELWTGLPAPLGVMQQKLLAALKQQG